MLLRRITQQVRDQNWFAVLLDLLIVIVGIYVGMQVSALKDTRDDRVLERQYLQRLLADMEVSITNHRQIDDEDRAGIESVDVLARNLRSGVITESDRPHILAALNYIGWVYRPSTNMVTVRELQSTGNISLIQNIAIRVALGRVELSFADAVYSAEQTSAILNTVSPEIMAWSFLEPAPNEKWGYKILPDMERMLATPDAGNIISAFTGWGKYHQSIMQSHYDETIALRDLIKASLAE